jgi:hypothetical protein
MPRAGKAAEPHSSVKSTAAAPSNSSRPLPTIHPPTKKPWLLATATLLQVAWIIFLIVLALRG